jgi:hypothetical protein
MIDPSRGAHGAQNGDIAALVLHEHDQARNDVQRGDQHDQGQDQKHDVALDLKCGEKGRGTPPPVDKEHRPPGGVCHRPSEVVDPVGLASMKISIALTSSARLK